MLAPICARGTFETLLRALPLIMSIFRANTIPGKIVAYRDIGKAVDEPRAEGTHDSGARKTLSTTRIHKKNTTTTASTPNRTLDDLEKPILTESASSSFVWDGWPDDVLKKDFSFDEVERLDDLQVHWATKTNGTRLGDIFALTWEGGKKSVRKCLGIIECDNPDCRIIIRPRTHPKPLQAQLQQSCKCGAVLYHERCSVHETLWKWAEGIHWTNSGAHKHPRPTHMLHLSGEEKNRFQDLVQAHPTVGPLGLIVGVPGINGPGKSVTEISDIFWNADRVSKERSKIKQGADVGGDGFIAAFKKLEEDHPEFVVSSTFGIVTVVSLQTPFMRSLLVRDTTLEEPVNGTVNDATHGWWSERNALLIVTSVYDVKTQSWSPSLFSYSNGARTLHFKYHFVALFQGIAEEADSRGIDIEDRLFAGV
ncbi:unnamed protein product [Cyclocybe aegerita]|uniref:Uncharacterized protein n=1 Tax=Cyclocybe aegerita TaxID=1973307 RepID=A0A8S0VV52_CYCAE|nr:unnamed protein product [Cyclocybe aegerita]